jgi:hypothetical protein
MPIINSLKILMSGCVDIEGTRGLSTSWAAGRAHGQLHWQPSSNGGRTTSERTVALTLSRSPVTVNRRTKGRAAGPGSPSSSSETHLVGEWESRFEIRVAWSTPPLPQVPLQITKSPSLTWLESMSLTFLSPWN